MKILIVTGILAKPIVEKYVTSETEVISLPVEVAALMSPQYVATKLRSMNTSKFEKILLPGLIPGDVSVVQQSTGVPTFKGPKHAADLPLVLEMIDKVQLSPITPASDLLSEALMQRASRELEAIKQDEIQLAARDQGLPITGGEETLYVGRGFSPRVLAEIVNASILSDATIRTVARRFVESGAQIIDLGMVGGGGDPENARRVVEVAKHCVPTPVSIDTSDVDEMKAAVDAGADLILSVNATTLKQTSQFASHLPVVVTPTNGDGYCPTDLPSKLQQLNSNLDLARSLAFKKVIADPVLTPLLTPNFTESLVAYFEFRKRDESLPVLFGAGNVTELVDCDSPGANMLLASVACELGVSIILTTEASDKTNGSVRELSTAVKMVSLAQRRNSPPKDLGLNLLRLKEKRRREEPFEPTREEKAQVLQAQPGEFVYDPAGFFKIDVDREHREIVVRHYLYGSSDIDFMIKGVDPLEITATIIANGLLSRLDHAAYLGVELEKAVIALITGRSYLQNFPQFDEDALALR